MSKLIKAVFAKDHGTYKKGDVATFAKSTADALIAHGILKVEKPKKEEKESKTE